VLVHAILIHYLLLMPIVIMGKSFVLATGHTECGASRGTSPRMRHESCRMTQNQHRQFYDEQGNATRVRDQRLEHPLCSTLRVRVVGIQSKKRRFLVSRCAPAVTRCKDPPAFSSKPRIGLLCIKGSTSHFTPLYTLLTRIAQIPWSSTPDVHNYPLFVHSWNDP